MNKALMLSQIENKFRGKFIKIDEFYILIGLDLINLHTFRDPSSPQRLASFTGRQRQS